ncbi:PAS domain S-box protein [Pedobacter rhizosphaerae]|uniref:histidine kinase n=1 Tax=Pedobacter rhizosphaerae TaxID=390241 RepID=A0A1H9MKP6_9SPHI|nr:PAS domain S-box protein [Pedobacter rhizosphaerae]SER24272.1 PAS domain S-box-containing protein [Pedobacter rhizosphaerae]
MNSSPYFLNNESLLQVIQVTPTATAIHVSEDAIIQFANDSMLQIWGKDKSVIGKSLEQALPELRGQPFIDMFKRVWNEGLIIKGTDTAATLEIEGILKTFYFDFEYRAIKNAEGEVICILHTAIDVTDRFLKQEAERLSNEKQEALEREQALNEELAATNEELSATNEELQNTQEILSRWNSELEYKVSERVKQLSESEGRFKTMAEGTDILIAVGDENGNAIYFNKAWTMLTGRRMEDLLEFGWVDLIHPDDKERYVQIYLDAFKKRTTFTGEFRILTVNGHYNWLLAVGPPRFHADGTFAGYISSCTDITILKKQEEDLQALNEELATTNEELMSSNEELSLTNEELGKTQKQLIHSLNKLTDSEEKLMLAIETGKMGTWSIDPETKSVSLSAFVKNMLGFHEDTEVEIDDIMRAVDPNYHEMLLNALDNALTSHGSNDTEYPVTNLKTGKTKWVKATGRVFTDGNGKPLEYSGLLMDITERKLDEIRKNDFIGMVSHELKTPLTALYGYVQVLQHRANKSKDEYFSHALAKANIQIKKMTSMINGFLNVSRLESSKLQISKSVFRLDELISEIVEDSYISPSTHQVILKPACEISVNADREKIGSVVSNLISNAFKYSENGTAVEISCEIIDDYAQVSIKDHGIGISNEDMKNLFQRYYRVESNHTISGFGIGLYLSSEIIQRHNGKIWVESEPEKGSTFYFSLPLNEN